MATRSIFILALVAVASVIKIDAAEVKLPCRLRHWVATSKGNLIPEGSFNIQGSTTNSYIVRKNVSTDTQYADDLDTSDPFYIGTLDQNVKKAYFPLFDEDANTTAIVSATYEILTNPEGCTIAWVDVGPGSKIPEFAAEIKPGVYIGMTSIDGGNYAGEVVFEDKPYLTVAIDTETLDNIEDKIKVLTSFSGGITLKLVNANIDLDDDDLGSPSTLGTEEIRNNANVQLSQTFSHSKKIREFRKTTIEESSTTKSVTNGGIDLVVFGKTYKEEHQFDETTTKTWTTETITDVTVTRTITIPPFTAIQACSLVTIRENVKVDYEADVVYYAPGMDGNEVIDIITAENATLGRSLINIDGLATMKGYKGVFEGSVAMDAVFAVADLSKNASCLEVFNENQAFKQKTVQAFHLK